MIGSSSLNLQCYVIAHKLFGAYSGWSRCVQKKYIYIDKTVCFASGTNGHAIFLQDEAGKLHDNLSTKRNFRNGT